MGVKWMPIGRIECRRLSNSLQRSTVTLAKKKKKLIVSTKKLETVGKISSFDRFFFPLLTNPCLCY